MIRIGSMYSGVAGMDLAVLAATEPHGRIVWHCESAQYPRAVLAERFPGVPCYESDEAIDETATPIDALIGGPPCQATSTAGKRKGADDERWRWPQFLRVVRILRPRVIYVENPASLLTLDDGRAFGDILGALAALGFHAEWTCVRASDVGAPHRRQRLFVLAYTAGDGARILAATRREGRDIARARGAVADTGCERRERCRESGGVGDAEIVSREQGRGSDESGNAARDRGEVMADADIDGRGGRGGRGETYHDDGYHAPWDEPDGCDSNRFAGREVESGLGRNFDGSPVQLDAHRWPAPPGPQFPWEPPRVTLEKEHRRPRLKALGNACVPHQALLAWRELVARI